MAHLKLASQSDTSQVSSTRIGRRLCLHERCERNFLPSHPLDRYCSPQCLHAARRWQVRYANQRYRRSENGKLRRKEQSQRYRQRSIERKSHQADESVPVLELNEPAEGYTKDSAHEKSCCRRPGCYRRFTPPPQSPLKKFCSSRCRKALRRVILRERKWLKRLNRSLKHARDGPHRAAS